jgi:hypothetical protein
VVDAVGSTNTKKEATVNTTNGSAPNGRPPRREITVTITVEITATRPGPPKGERGTYRAIVNGEEIAARSFDGGWRKKAEARRALFAMLDTIEALH